jgi:tetratricopeptide (TPR) repeat protein
VTNRLYNLKGQDLFFAWFSRGSIQVEMDDYFGASQSYDEAFKIYETLETKDRPWRILWYQTGPYFSYYWTGRYHDLRNLAQQTLDITPEDAIPETWVWKGRAEVMMGLRDEAIESFKQALVWHPGWWVAENELTALGVTPP